MWVPAGSSCGDQEVSPAESGPVCVPGGGCTNTSWCSIRRRCVPASLCRGHPLRATGQVPSDPGFLLRGAVGSSPRGSQRWCWLGAHQLLQNKKLGPSHWVLEEELRAAPAVVSRHPPTPNPPTAILSCPRLLLEICSADAKPSLGNHFSRWIRILQSLLSPEPQLCVPGCVPGWALGYGGGMCCCAR